VHQVGFSLCDYVEMYGQQNIRNTEGSYYLHAEAQAVQEECGVLLGE